MNGLYHKEMRKENAQLPQMLESSRDAKWAYAFNGESQTESESESESQLESDSQSESKLQTESELQLESTEVRSLTHHSASDYLRLRKTYICWLF